MRLMYDMGDLGEANVYDINSAGPDDVFSVNEVRFCYSV